jgi:hypothetical protein
MSRSRCVFTLTLVLALVCGGCSVGPRIEAVDAAHTPAGIATVVRTSKATYEGELLCVADDGLLLLVAERLTSVPFDAIEDVDARPVLRVRGMRRRAELNSKEKEKLRKCSRFPQGVSKELELALLSAYGQAEVTRVER